MRFRHVVLSLAAALPMFAYGCAAPAGDRRGGGRRGRRTRARPRSSSTSSSTARSRPQVGDPQQTIKDQMLFTIGQLNGKTGVGRLDKLDAHERPQRHVKASSRASAITRSSPSRSRRPRRVSTQLHAHPPEARRLRRAGGVLHQVRRDDVHRPLRARQSRPASTGTTTGPSRAGCDARRRRRRQGDRDRRA